MSAKVIITICLVLGICLFVGGFFPFSYYSVIYTHYYIAEMPTDQQKQIICDTDMFTVISVTPVSSYCCNEYYDVYVHWSHAFQWNYGERENQIKDYLEDAGLQITEKCK